MLDAYRPVPSLDLAIELGGEGFPLLRGGIGPGPSGGMPAELCEEAGGV